MEKYKIREAEAQALSDFLLPMLEWYPERRATAQEMLSHPWLNMPDNYDTFMSDGQYEKMKLMQSLKGDAEEEGEKAMSELA